MGGGRGCVCAQPTLVHDSLGGIARLPGGPSVKTPVLACRGWEGLGVVRAGLLYSRPPGSPRLLPAPPPLLGLGTKIPCLSDS